MTASAPASVSRGRTASGPLDVLYCEWTKLRTVRSTWCSLLVAVAGTIAVGLLICATIVARWDQLPAASRAHFDPTLRSLTGLFVGQLAIGVLGVLAITSEYATGMIRSTLTAVPRRRQMLAAKAAALAAPALVICTAACAGAATDAHSCLLSAPNSAGTQGRRASARLGREAVAVRPGRWA